MTFGNAKLRSREAQKAVLAELAESESRQHYDDNYKPIVRLLELGYVDRQAARFGGNLYGITTAGREALLQAQDQG